MTCLKVIIANISGRAKPGNQVFYLQVEFLSITTYSSFLFSHYLKMILLYSATLLKFYACIYFWAFVYAVLSELNTLPPFFNFSLDVMSFGKFLTSPSFSAR